MKLIGLNFNKMSIERTSDSLANAKISTNIDVSEISKIKNTMFQGKEELIEVKFKYDVLYTPDIAKVELEGKVLFAVDLKASKEILKKWEEKQIPEDFKMAVFNIIFRKANIKALLMEDELNLPPHLPFPTMAKGEKNQKD